MIKVTRQQFMHMPHRSSTPQGTSQLQMGKAENGRWVDQNAEATPAVPAGETLPLE